jgi:hypothetical protein
MKKTRPFWRTRDEALRTRDGLVMKLKLRDEANEQEVGCRLSAVGCKNGNGGSRL